VSRRQATTTTRFGDPLGFVQRTGYFTRSETMRRATDRRSLIRVRDFPSCKPNCPPVRNRLHELPSTGPLRSLGQTRREPLPTLKGRELFNARGSTILFLAGIVLIVLIGMIPALRPVYQTVENGIVDSDQVSMGMAIMIVMIAIAGVAMIIFKASPEATLKGSIMKSGVVALISILGVSWLGSSFFEGNRAFIVSGIAGMIRSYPWAFAAGLFILSTLLFSAAATVAMLMPVGVALGLQTSHLIAFYPAANSVFFSRRMGRCLPLFPLIKPEQPKSGNICSITVSCCRASLLWFRRSSSPLF
jgi:hypothetical protein